MSKEMQLRRVESLGELKGLKQQYMQHTSAPLDGMWLCGFVPQAAHYAFHDSGELLGYCCVNDEGYLLQFFCDPQADCRPGELFAALFEEAEGPAGKLKGVFVSTAEPQTLSLCLDRFPNYEVNALMYQRSAFPVPEPGETTPPLVLLEEAQLPLAVDFAVSTIGAPADWLRGYYGNLIQRAELHGAWRSEELVALGESRGYDEFQVGYADLGVIVAQSERGRGHATQVLRQLARRNEGLGLRSICSTERGNFAAQKAIERAGFQAGHRILQFHASGPR